MHFLVLSFTHCHTLLIIPTLFLSACHLATCSIIFCQPSILFTTKFPTTTKYTTNTKSKYYFQLIRNMIYEMQNISHCFASHLTICLSFYVPASVSLVICWHPTSHNFILQFYLMRRRAKQENAVQFHSRKRIIAFCIRSIAFNLIQWINVRARKRHIILYLGVEKWHAIGWQ